MNREFDDDDEEDAATWGGAGVKAAAAPTKSEKIAAADAVVREITQAWHDDPVPHDLEVTANTHAFSVQLADGNWRKVTLLAGNRMFWKGLVRSSTKGDLLFGFEPATTRVGKRDIRLIELPHTDLAIPNKVLTSASMVDWLTNAMGATMDEMLRNALTATSPDEVGTAGCRPDEAEPPMDETHDENFGAWG